MSCCPFVSELVPGKRRPGPAWWLGRDDLAAQIPRAPDNKRDSLRFHIGDNLDLRKSHLAVSHDLVPASGRKRQGLDCRTLAERADWHLVNHRAWGETKPLAKASAADSVNNGFVLKSRAPLVLDRRSAAAATACCPRYACRDDRCLCHVRCPCGGVFLPTRESSRHHPQRRQPQFSESRKKTGAP
jgi:hypothetical protein